MRRNRKSNGISPPASAHCGWWLDNGGGATLISYGQNEGDQADVTVVPDGHLKWMFTVTPRAPYSSSPPALPAT
jgi:hypothetical protein